MIRFAFYIHNHQPVGNFGEVFEHAYSHSYLPLLKVFKKHKKIKFGIHNSGPLLEWIIEHHPEYCEMLREMVRRGQAEIISSAYAEPILSLIPKRDAIDQIKYYNDYVYKYFSFQPKGLWLTERVWEPGLIPLLIEAGIEYTLLDNTVFLSTGLKEDELYSYYLTEDNGKVLKIFPVSMKLRYLIPFHHIDETISYLKKEENNRGKGLVTFGDDGEKFGVWPGTNDWVYNKGWLDKFLSRIEREKWIKTVWCQHIINEAPAGRIYLPTASYEEMGGWTLPDDIGKVYDKIKRIMNGKYSYLIPGGYFNNFLRKYPEANLMHKRMLNVSLHIADDINAKLPLWRGQCSCAYWHGIFGGLYLSHLREAVYKNLIEADNTNIKKEMFIHDFDVDGKDEIVFSDENFFFVIKPRSASFIELDDRKRKLNILNYLGRRQERYHKKIPKVGGSKKVRSIHEICRSKEKNLVDYLIYDSYPRSFGLDRILKRKPTSDDFRRGKKLGKIVDYEHFQIVNKKRCIIKFLGKIEKTIELTKKQKRVLQICYQGNINLLGIEFPMGIFGTKLMLNGKKNLFDMCNIDNIQEFSITADNDMPILFRADEVFNLLSYPIETISSSEAGFEKNFQGFNLMLIFSKSPTIWIEL